MIVGFRDNDLRDFFVDDIRAKRIPVELQTRLFRKLQLIDDATTDQDLRVPPANHFESCAAPWTAFTPSASISNGG